MMGQLKQMLYMRSSSYIVVSRCLKTAAKPHMSEDRPKESWNAAPEKDPVPKGEWRSMFGYFTPDKGITVDIVHFLQKGIDLRPKAMQKWLKKTKQKKMIYDQRFRPDRVAALGYDLAAAHFIVHRGGKVKFQSAQEWTEQDEDGEYELPAHYVPNLALEALDASGTNLVYEGIECIAQLKKLKWLSVADCPHIDDWCLDRICGQFSSTLQHLDISNCKKITERGISALSRLRELRSLHINGLDDTPDIKLLCVLLEDTLPEVQISGVDYLSLTKS